MNLSKNQSAPANQSTQALHTPPARRQPASAHRRIAAGLMLSLACLAPLPGLASGWPHADFSVFVDPPTGFVFVKLPAGWKFIGTVDAEVVAKLPASVLTDLRQPDTTTAAIRP